MFACLFFNAQVIEESIKFRIDYEKSSIFKYLKMHTYFIKGNKLNYITDTG